MNLLTPKNIIPIQIFHKAGQIMYVLNLNKITNARFIQLYQNIELK